MARSSGSEYQSSCTLRRGPPAAVLSRIATEGNHGENSLYFEGWKAYESDPYHPTRNPRGVIQMGLAENQLCFDMMEEWIKKHPEASICTAQGVSEFRETAIFQDYHGLPAFRTAVARFMEKARGGRVRFDPDRIVMGGGATGASELLIFCLADPGDAFLVPTPYYPGFDRDLRWRTGIQLIPVACDSSNHFKLTREALEAAYGDAVLAGVRVKGLILANPSNPLGTVLDRETLAGLLSFADEHRIHLVCDEIYSATVSGADFVSVAEVLEEEEQRGRRHPGGARGICDRDLVHIVYSLSKDLGLPGFRVGVVYSYNDEVVRCGRRMSSFGLVSSQTQRLLASMLSDDAFVGAFLEESARRLGERRAAFAAGLAEVGIRCLQGGATAGLFLWMDLRPLLEEEEGGRTAEAEAEAKLWRAIVEEVKLNVSPGSSFHCAEPGWFRVCVANMDDATVAVALQRMRRFVGRSAETGLPALRRRRAGAASMALRLSLSTSSSSSSTLIRAADDVCMASAMSPRVLSPHSPLVRATS